MGLLAELTVRYKVDLSALKSGTEEAKGVISGLKDIAESASTPLKAMNVAFRGSEVSAEVTTATTSITILARDAAQTGSALKQAGTDAEKMGSEAASGAGKADAALDRLKNKSKETGSGFLDLAEKARGGFAGLIGGITSFASHLTTTILNMGALGQQAVSLGESLLEPAASAKEVQSSLEIFDGSTQAALDEMQKLADFTSHTPFETTDIDNLALKMQGVGISSQDVIPDLTALGDAMDAMGDTSASDLGDLVNSFNKIQATGHLTGEVIASFADKGINVWKILEQQTGKTQAQLQKMVSDGAIPASDAMRYLTQGIEASPLYKGQMANDAQGVAGALSNMKANFDQVLVSIGSPILDQLVPIFNDIGAALAKPDFKAFAGSVGQGIASVFAKVGDAAKNIDFKALGDNIKQVGDWFNTSLKPALDQAKPSFDQLATTVGNLATSALPPLLQAAGDLAPKVVTLAGDIAGGLNTAIVTVTGSFNTWGPIVTGVGITLTAVFIPAIIKSGVESTIAGAKLAGQFVVNVTKAGIEGWSAAGKLAVFVGNLIATGAQAIWAGIQISAQFVANMVKAGTEAVIAGGKIVVSFIGSLIQAAAQAAVTGAAFLADLVPTIISMTADAIVFAATAIPAVLAGFASWVIGAAGVAIANIAAFWPIYLVVAAIIIIIGLVVLAIQHWGDIVSWLQGIWGAISGFFIGLFNGIVDFFKKWGVDILVFLLGPIAIVIRYWGTISQFFQGVWTNITKIFQGAATWFHDHVWQPVVDRFTQVFNGLKDKAAGIWSSITAGVRSAFNTVIDLINNGISGVNNISSKVGIPAIPFLPHLQTGGFIQPGTWAVAGDPGPSSELVYGGQAGATVFSHSQSMAMLAANAGAGGGSRGGDTHVHIYLDSQEIAHYSAEATADVVVRKLLGHGPVRDAA